MNTRSGSKHWQCTSIGALCLLASLLWACPAFSQIANAKFTRSPTLKNPGFEDGSGKFPEYWWHALSPVPGAKINRDSEVAHSGKYSAAMAFPLAGDDMWANWAMNLEGVPRDMTLIFSAFVKADKIDKASLLIQCWDSSGTNAKAVAFAEETFHGTFDWELKTVTVDVPKETQLVTVRCMLMSTGTAWFDDLSVSTRELETEEETEKEAETTETEKPETEVVEPPKEDVRISDAERELLIEAQKTLSESLSVNKLAIESFVAMNAKLLDEINGLKNELEHYKALAEKAEQAKTVSEAAPSPSKEVAEVSSHEVKTSGAPFRIPPGQEL